MIGFRLKELRKRQGKTQEQVAKDLSVHKQTYQNYELEKREPDIYMLSILADYFHTTIDYLVDHDVPYLINKSQFSSEQLEIIEGIKSLDKDQCNATIAFIKGLNVGKKLK